MKLGRAVASGVLGALLVLVLLWLARWLLGTPTDLARLLGNVLLPGAGRLAWWSGVALQLVVGAAAGVVYAAVFEYAMRRAGPLAGVGVAIPHAAIAGLLVGFLPLWRWPIASPLPGAFLAFAGATAAACFIVAHLAFGALVGLCYGRTRHRATAPAPVWRELGRG